MNTYRNAKPRLFRSLRPRAVRRERLERSAAPDLPGKRVSSLAEVARFLADPLAYSSPAVGREQSADGARAAIKSAYAFLLPATPPWPLGGIATPETTLILTAQAHALNGRFDEAISSMQQVIERLSESEASLQPWSWLVRAETPAISDRKRKERSEMLAVACAFIASARLARGDRPDQIDDLEKALRGR